MAFHPEICIKAKTKALLHCHKHAMSLKGLNIHCWQEKSNIDVTKERPTIDQEKLILRHTLSQKQARQCCYGLEIGDWGLGIGVNYRGKSRNKLRINAGIDLTSSTVCHQYDHSPFRRHSHIHAQTLTQA